MYALAALGITAFLLCFILTPIFRDIFLKLKLVDLPDGDRKLHSKPIPRIGGLPIALSYMGALILVLAFAPARAALAIQHPGLLRALLPAAGVVFLTGLVDDLLTLKPWQKLIGQVGGAALAVLGGARIEVLHGHPYDAWLSVPLSLFWLIGCTNAFNLIDGMDGLAPGVGLFGTLTALLAAVLQGNWGLAMATVPLAGCLLAFLRYNFNPASVFLGDSGSLTIGFLLGCFSVIWSQKSATLLGMLAPIMALALPLFDVGLSISRRFLRNQPIFKPDRGHIHHRLLALGLKPRDAALICYAVCVIAAAFSLMQSSLSYHLGGPMILLFCCLSWMGIKRLKYVEFSTTGRVLREGGILRLLEQEIYLESFRDALAKANTYDECWATIKAACRELDFASVELLLQGKRFQEVLHLHEDGPLWNYTVSIGRANRISLSRVGQSKAPSILTSFFDALHNGIEMKNAIWAKDGEPGLGLSTKGSQIRELKARTSTRRAAAS